VTQPNEARDATALLDEIWIDPHVLELAGLDYPAIEEWTEWAEWLLDEFRRSGEWRDGLPILSDRGPNRGPGGERYVLLGFAGQLLSPPARSSSMPTHWTGG
jgi:hypothetical protein